MIKNILFYESNLTVEDALEINSNLKFIKKLPIKEIKFYLMKIAKKFKNLHVLQLIC
jgi:hypothetical protein